MTATILTFPSMFDRDQAEFEHFGASNYTRALEEAAHLWNAATAQAGVGDLTPRIDALVAAIEHLGRYRPESLGEPVVMDDGARVELGIVPDVLRAFGRAA